MAEYVLLLGADRGDVAGTFMEATRQIGMLGNLRAESRNHWTEPWGMEDTALFLNRALLVESGLGPQAMMQALLKIEERLGRVRGPGHGPQPRTIDIDILFIGEQVINEPGLVVPHPRVHERAFALGPAADLVPGLVHPVLGRTVLELLNAVQQQ